MKFFRSLLRPVPASMIAMVVATAVWAASANVALLTGPQPAADLLGILNSLINSNNAAYGPNAGNVAAGGFAVTPRNQACGSQVPHVSTEYTNTTPVITEVQICEVFIPANMTVTGAWYFTGTASSGGGNVKVGLANSNGAVVATSASTAGGTNDAIQSVDFTAPYAAVGPATYYILTIYDTATAGFYNAPPLGRYGCGRQTGQVYATGFTTITPPTTFTANGCNVGGLY